MDLLAKETNTTHAVVQQRKSLTAKDKVRKKRGVFVFGQDLRNVDSPAVLQFLESPLGIIPICSELARQTCPRVSLDVLVCDLTIKE